MSVSSAYKNEKVDKGVKAVLKQPCQLYEFLRAAGGNWRNAVFIECRGCPYGKSEPCSGFLMAPDAEGRPIILAVGAVCQASGQGINKAECLAVMSRESFETLYALWLSWQTESSKECALI